MKKYNSPEKSSNPWSDWSSPIEEASKNRWKVSARAEASLLLRFSWLTSSCLEAAIVMNYCFDQLRPGTFLTHFQLSTQKQLFCLIKLCFIGTKINKLSDYANYIVWLKCLCLENRCIVWDSLKIDIGGLILNSPRCIESNLLGMLFIRLAMKFPFEW